MIPISYSYILKKSEYAEDISNYSATEWNGNLYNVNPKREWSESLKRRMTGITVSQPNGLDVNAYLNGGIQKLYGDKSPTVLVLGDSHALMWAKILDEIAQEIKISISFYSADGTSTFFDIPPKKERATQFFSAEEKYNFDYARLKYLHKWKPKIVVIACRWESIVDIQETYSLIEYIGNIGSKILLIEQPPALFFGDKNAPQYLSYIGMSPLYNKKYYIDYNDTSRYQEGLQTVKKITEKYNFCKHVTVTDLFIKNNQALAIDSYNVLYIDDDHLSYSGSLKVKHRISVKLKEFL